VAQFMSDHMWLWSRGYEGGGPQAELLRRIAHWLMREPDLEEEDLRATFAGGRIEIQRRSLAPEHPEIEVTFPSGKTQKVTLEPGPGGRASATIAAAEGGLYRIGDGRRTALAAAGPLNPREFEDLRASPDALAPLLKASGGTVVRLISDGLPSLRKVSPTRDRFGRGWIGVTSNRGYVVTGVAQTPLLPAIVLLFLTLGAALFAWYREGR
jgi:predicted Rdx family selenoprotein